MRMSHDTPNGQDNPKVFHIQRIKKNDQFSLGNVINRCQWQQDPDVGITSQGLSCRCSKK
jgi:hypothetical protein